VTRFPWLIVILFFAMPNPLVSLLGGAWSLPAVMLVISALIYALRYDSEYEYSLWSVLLLAGQDSSLS
jgi:hypothetical protein